MYFKKNRNSGKAFSIMYNAISSGIQLAAVVRLINFKTKYKMQKMRHNKSFEFIVIPPIFKRSLLGTHLICNFFIFYRSKKIFFEIFL